MELCPPTPTSPTEREAAFQALRRAAGEEQLPAAASPQPVFQVSVVPVQVVAWPLAPPLPAPQRPVAPQRPSAPAPLAYGPQRAAPHAPEPAPRVPGPPPGTAESVAQGAPQAAVLKRKLVLGSDELPSKGSYRHDRGGCKPCAYFWSRTGCENGAQCSFCHLCGKADRKRRMKQRRAAREARELEEQEELDSQEQDDV